MKWWAYILCSVFIVLGIFASLELFDLFNVRSVEFGTVLTLEKKQKFDIEADFDLGFIDFDSEDKIIYSSQISQVPINFNGTGKKLNLLLNSQQANSVVVSSGKIEGFFEFNFYNTDGEIESTAKLKVLIEFFATDTQIKFEIKNENNSIGYLNRYLELNGAKLKIVSKEAKYV